MHVSRETLIPDLDPESFRSQISRVSPIGLDSATVARLYVHFSELRRWNQRLSLVGPGTALEVIERHFGESLAALRLLPSHFLENLSQLPEQLAESPPSEGPTGGLSPNVSRETWPPETSRLETSTIISKSGIRSDAPLTLVDVGSGGGFPGLVLALVLTDFDAYLVESRSKKLEFLRSAARKASRNLNLIGNRFDLPLPAELPQQIDLLTLRAVRLTDALWSAAVGRLSPRGRILVWCGVEEPLVPDGAEKADEIALEGSSSRRIVSWRAIQAG